MLLYSFFLMLDLFFPISQVETGLMLNSAILYSPKKRIQKHHYKPHKYLTFHLVLLQCLASFIFVIMQHFYGKPEELKCVFKAQQITLNSLLT